MVRARVTVRDIDRGWEKMLKAAKQLEQRPYIEVGLPGGTGADVLLIGLVHEFGTVDSRIPERSWLRGAYDAHHAEWSKLGGQLLAKVVEGKLSVEKGLGLLGEKIVSDIKKHIKERIPPPLADATIEAKGSDIPLIDTAQFINSISYKVVMP